MIQPPRNVFRRMQRMPFDIVLGSGGPDAKPPNRVRTVSEMIFPQIG